MDITYYGHSSFKITASSSPLGVRQKVSVVTDPFDPKMVGLKFPSVEGDIVTVSHDHADHNSIDKVTGYKKVVNGPGEYEILGVSIMGYPTYHDAKNGQERGKNTVYTIEVEGLRLAHLGDLGHTLSDDLIDELGDVDILMLPVGGFYTIGPKEATEIITKIEPYYVIPMHYSVDGLNEDIKSKLAPIDDFLKESGLTVERFPKFLIKKEDILEEQTTKIVVLEKK